MPLVESGQENPYLSFPFNAFCDLLSGANWLEASDSWSLESPFKENEAVLSILQARFGENCQFLFSSADNSLPLEIFWLKWKLFSCLCQRVFDIHRYHHRPYLGLYPDRLQILLPDIWDGISPSRWHFWVHLPDHMGAQVFNPTNILSEFNQPFFLPFHAVMNFFQAPEIRDWPLEKEELVTVLIQEMERIVNHPDVPAHQAQGRLRMHILSDTANLATFTSRDLLRIHLHGIQGGEDSIIIWGRVHELTERGMVVDGRTVCIPQAQWEHLEAISKQPFMRTPMVVFRQFHIPSDLYSLGRMLFHILLDRGSGNVNRLNVILPRLVSSLERQSSCRKEGEDEDSFCMSLLQRERNLFSKGAIVYPTKQKFSRSRIPDELWYSALILGLRLMVRKSGWGIAAHAGDYDERNIHQAMGTVLRHVQDIGTEIQLELFGNPTRNQDILQSCQMLRNEMFKKKGALGAL